jgi:hypothetical protein
LILPAGLAIQDLKEVKSIKGMVVVDISSAPHIDWTTEAGGVPVQTWTDLLESEAHHEPSEPAPVAIQSFIASKKNFKAVDFTQQVQLLDEYSNIRTLLQLLRANLNFFPKIMSCPRMMLFFPWPRSRTPSLARSLLRRWHQVFNHVFNSNGQGQHYSFILLRMLQLKRVCPVSFTRRWL